MVDSGFFTNLFLALAHLLFIVLLRCVVASALRIIVVVVVTLGLETCSSLVEVLHVLLVVSDHRIVRV